jgi:proteasome lid subunit RPN8/RPN11
MKAREREASVLAVGSAAFQAMLHHAKQDKPREAVGLLAGDSSGIASLTLPLANIAGPGAFLADPYSQYLAEKRISAERLSLIAIYHSHPGGSAYLSAVDREFATLRDVINIVIAPAHRDCPLDTRAYRVRGGIIVRVDLHIIPDG